MTQINIDPKCALAVANFKLPEQLAFGLVPGPLMAICDYKNGKWGELQILPYGPITMYPSAKVLHYAQEVFEGMKAYKIGESGPFIFRPEENLIRFNKSAERMAMPTVPAEIFMSAVDEIVSLSGNAIPRRSGESLYLRPFMYASEEALGIKPADEYRFMVITSPSASFFSGAAGGVSVYIERNDARAFPGGTGFAKSGGNYAASLMAAIKTKKLGFTQTLWLDAVHKKNVEEMSGMNIFFIINGELHTSKIGDTILDGITRKSLLVLAQDMGIKTVERDINIDELIEQIKNGQCTEAFACGTAAIVAPISDFGEADGRRYQLSEPDGKLSLKLRQNLLGIQEGQLPDTHNWIKTIEQKTL